ncbi:MAG: porin family protein [Cyclobacteriaceae bacterium]
MKKLILTISMVTFSVLGVFAQVSGGLKAGVNLANQRYEGDIFTAASDARTGFHAGGYLNIGFGDKFSIQPELLYNSVGAKLSNTDFKTDYLSIPVMLKFSPAPIFNFHFGPQFGFLMSAKFDGVDVRNDYKDIDLGLGVGIGVDLPLGLGVSARYVFGLANIYADDVSNAKVTNTAFQISATLRLFGG